MQTSPGRRRLAAGGSAEGGEDRADRLVVGRDEQAVEHARRADLPRPAVSPATTSAASRTTKGSASACVAQKSWSTVRSAPVHVRSSSDSIPWCGRSRSSASPPTVGRPAADPCEVHAGPERCHPSPRYRSASPSDRRTQTWSEARRRRRARRAEAGRSLARGCRPGRTGRAGGDHGQSTASRRRRGDAVHRRPRGRVRPGSGDGRTARRCRRSVGPVVAVPARIDRIEATSSGSRVGCPVARDPRVSPRSSGGLRAQDVRGRRGLDAAGRGAGRGP